MRSWLVKPTPQIVLVLVALTLEVIYFPQLVMAVMHAIGKAAGPGSEVIAFRDLCVLPGAILFFLIASIVLILIGKRRGVIAAVWLANVVAALGAILIYRSIVGPWD